MGTPLFRVKVAVSKLIYLAFIGVKIEISFSFFFRRIAIDRDDKCSLLTLTTHFDLVFK